LVRWSKFKDEDQDWLERDDVTRVHVGGEYLFALNPEKQRAWFVRAGYMWEESNAVRANSHDPKAQESFPREEPRDHVTFGLGLALERFQVDVGVDRCKDKTDLILSTVVYF